MDFAPSLHILCPGTLLGGRQGAQTHKLFFQFRVVVSLEPTPENPGHEAGASHLSPTRKAHHHIAATF